MSCKLTLYEDDLGRNASENITASGPVGNLNNRASSVKMTGDCSNTAWALMENPGKDGDYGTGIIIGKGDENKILNINDPNHHGQGKGSRNHRFYKWYDRVSHVHKIDVPIEGIQKDIRIYGKRADRLGQWGHYPYINSSDFAQHNNFGHWIDGEGTTGKPCPGGKGYPIGHRTFRCIYNTGAEIQGLYSGVLNAPAGDPRIDLYGEVVGEFCKDVNNIDKIVGGGNTCEDYGANRTSFCSQDDKIKKDPTCTRGIMGDVDYDSIASSYCKSNPNDTWCSCYNLVNKICDSNMNAAGCKDANRFLDENKDAFGIVSEVSAAEYAVANEEPGAEQKLKEAQAKNGYNILKSKTHCRPYACKDGFLPSNHTQGCASSYRICDKDIDIRNSTNTDIVIACNADFRPSALPDWWDDPFDESFFDKDRVYPYTIFPLNRTPMHTFPKKFTWKSKNVRYHVYTGSGITAFISCLCILMIVMIRRR